MDDVDRAQEINDLHLDIALTAQRAVADASMASGISLDECLDCGGEISEARQAAVPGCTRCIACQEKFENPKRKAA